MTRRNLVHISREPMQLSDVTIQPVLFTVLFIFIFGGASRSPGGSYKDFALAGLLPEPDHLDHGHRGGAEHRPARGHDRPLPHLADVAGRGAGRDAPSPTS
jgi:hypothetical protein